MEYFHAGLAVLLKITSTNKSIEILVGIEHNCKIVFNLEQDKRLLWHRACEPELDCLFRSHVNPRNNLNFYIYNPAVVFKTNTKFEVLKIIED